MTKSKCKLCGSVIEGLEGHIVECNCGEITLDGERKAVMCKTSLSNYVEVDNEGNEIVLVEKERPRKEELVNMLYEIGKSYEQLPEIAKVNPVNHYDLETVIMLVVAIMRAEKEEL